MAESRGDNMTIKLVTDQKVAEILFQREPGKMVG